MPIDDLGANKNSVGGNTSPSSIAPAAIAVNSPARRDLPQLGAGVAVAASGGSQGLEMYPGISMLRPARYAG